MPRYLIPERQKDREANARSRARKRGEKIPYLNRRQKDNNGDFIPQHGTNEEYSAYGCRCDLCKEAARIVRQRNKPDTAVTAMKRRAKRESHREITRQAKNEPCMDCNQCYPYFVMQFDHLYDKKFALSSSDIDQHSREEVLAEIKKCEIVCSNCHHIRTHLRRNKFYVATPENYNLQFGHWHQDLEMAA